jgi:signal transduction histidine kinase
MTTHSLRFRYFTWLAVVLVAYFLIYSAGLFAYNRFETMEQHHDAVEEFQEFLTLLGLGLVMMPIMLAVAWEVSRRMLAPLRAMADTAQRISEGALTERIAVPPGNDELSSLALTLNSAFDRFHQAVRRLEQFSSDASHQLRNPLMGLRGTGEISLQRARSDDEYRETIGGMLEEVDRLTRVVNQLLAMARLDAARLRADFALHDALALTRHVLDLRRSQAEARGLQLELDNSHPVSLFGSRTLVMEALANLVDNAIRHSLEGGRVTVGVAVANGLAMWQVRDRGPGLPAEKLPQLFQRFHRGDHDDPQSVGLGLSIAAEIVHLHQGTLDARNHPEGGAEFTLRIPATEPTRRTHA